MKLLICFMLLLSFSGCGKGAYRSRDEIRNTITAQLQVGLSTPTDATLRLGTPDDSGNRTFSNRYFRYNDSEGGFVELDFVSDVLSSVSEPSTY